MNTFREGALKAVNLGHDSDTVGAIFGQLAGAHYGLNGIPPSWVEKITLKDEIIELADRLFVLSGVEEVVTRAGSANARKPP